MCRYSKKKEEINRYVLSSNTHTHTYKKNAENIMKNRYER